MKNNVSEKTQIQIGVLLSYVSQMVSLLSGLIYTPIMLRLLGQSEYGLYQVANSVVSYLGLLNFGFSSGYLRIFFRYKVNNKDSEIAGLNGMFLMIFSVISVICFVCGIVIIMKIKWIFSDGLTNQELQKMKLLMLVMIMNLIITFLSSVFDCYLSAFEQFAFQRGIQVLKSVFNPFLTLPLLIAGYGSIAMVLVTTTLTFLGFLSSVIYCKKRLRMKFSLKSIEKGIFKEISHFTFWIFLSTVVDKINLSLDNFLLGRMCGTTIVAIYSVGGQINGFYNMISSSIATIYAPKINNVVAKCDDNNLLTNMFIDFSRFVFLILSFVLVAFIFLGQYFIRIWAGEGYSNSFYVAVILMIGCFISLLQLCGIEIQKAKNMHKFRSIVFFLIAILNIAISILLIRKFAEIGAALGTAMTMILGNGVVMNYYYQYKIGLNMKKYWIEMFKLTRFLIIPIIIGISYTFLDKNIMTFIISGILMLIFYFLPIYKSYKTKNLKLF